MKIKLGEVRRVIRNVLVESSRLLSETRVIADKSDGASQYRVISLTAAGDDAGKLIITPMSMPKYGKESVGSYLTDLGLQPSYPKDIPSFNQTPEQKAQIDAYHKQYHSVGEPIVVDVDKGVIDLGDAVKYNDHKDRRPGADGNKSRSYVIPHGGVAGNNQLTLQKILKALMKHDKRVTSSFTIIGNPKYEDQTIENLLKTTDPATVISRGGNHEPIVMYHGTSAKRWEIVKEKGLRPGNAPEVYSDLVSGFSEFNVYLTTNIDIAENYATRAAVDDKSKAVVVKVLVRDTTKFIVDEDGTGWATIASPGPPWTEKSEKGEEIEIHFRHQYKTPWQQWPNANQIWAIFNRKLIKNLRSAGTVAYKGSISKNDVSLYSIYKPKGMRGDPDDTEFDAARADTFASYERGEKKPEPKKTQAGSQANSGGKSYKVYGKKGGAPAHTRFKGKAYLAGKDTKFKSGDAASVAPQDGKLKVTSGDNTQLWEPEE